jgi:hypothetical protein
MVVVCSCPARSMDASTRRPDDKSTQILAECILNRQYSIEYALGPMLKPRLRVEETIRLSVLKRQTIVPAMIKIEHALRHIDFWQ